MNGVKEKAGGASKSQATTGHAYLVKRFFLPISTKMKRIGHTKFRKFRRDIVFVNYQSNDMEIKGMFP